jgi:hypothetical protein
VKCVNQLEQSRSEQGVPFCHASTLPKVGLPGRRKQVAAGRAIKIQAILRGATDD